MATWAQFRPWVLMEVDKAPVPVVDDAIRRTVRDFCQNARVWQEIQNGYNTAIGIQQYQFLPGTNVGEVYLPMAGQIGTQLNQELLFRSNEWCDEAYPGWRGNKHSGRPCVLTVVQPDGTFYLVPTPTQVEPFVLTVALQPRSRASACPTFLLTDHHDAIVAGAKARLMAMNGKEWANPQLATAYAAIYVQARDAANSRAARGFTRGPLRVKGHYV